MKLKLPYSVLFFLFITAALPAQEKAPDSGIIIYSIFDVNETDEIVKLDALAGKYQGKKVRFVAVSDKVNSNAKKVIGEHSNHYEQLPQPLNHEVFNKFQTSMMKVFPMHVIVDQEGALVFKKKGRSKGIEEKLDRKIERLLKKYAGDSSSESVLAEVVTDH